jgi:hypothetical protein
MMAGLILVITAFAIPCLVKIAADILTRLADSRNSKRKDGIE